MWCCFAELRSQRNVVAALFSALSLGLFLQTGCLEAQVPDESEFSEAEFSEAEPGVPVLGATWLPGLDVVDASVNGSAGRFNSDALALLQTELHPRALKLFAQGGGRTLMIRLRFYAPMVQLLSANSLTLSLDDLDAIGCEGPEKDLWSFDEEPTDGRVTITPTGPSMWNVDFSLLWPGAKVGGFFSIAHW